MVTFPMRLGGHSAGGTTALLKVQSGSTVYQRTIDNVLIDMKPGICTVLQV